LTIWFFAAQRQPVILQPLLDFPIPELITSATARTAASLQLSLVAAFLKS
jgi:hypothetical protein